MNKLLKTFFLIGLVTVSFSAQAQENTNKSELRANLKDLSFIFANTKVNHAQMYQDSQISELSADTQMQLLGKLDFALEYEREKFRWDNSVKMAYGKTKIKEVDGDETTNEPEDIILFTTDYAHKMWTVRNADAGPFVNIGYETEFTKNDDSPRTSLSRGKAGVKLFGGAHFEDLYAAFVEEADFTYSKTNMKSALEIGYRFKIRVREGVAFVSEGYYRDYFKYSQKNASDLKYDLKLFAKMEVELYKNLNFAPYFSYRQAQSRMAEKTGSSVIIGVAIGYGNCFDL